jgi:hypothetical protein
LRGWGQDPEVLTGAASAATEVIESQRVYEIAFDSDALQAAQILNADQTRLRLSCALYGDAAANGDRALIARWGHPTREEPVHGVVLEIDVQP